MPSGDAFDVRVHRRVAKDLVRAPEHVLAAFERALDALAHDPFRSRAGFDVRPVRGRPGLYRLRLGSWRVLYEVHPDERVVLFTTASPRGRAYRR